MRLRSIVSIDIFALFTSADIVCFFKGSVLYGAMLIIKQFAVHKCGHEKNPISANECLYSFLKKNKDGHYFLATQDQELTEKIRKLLYVPVIYMKMSTIVLEKPADQALANASATIDDSTQVDSHQMSTLKQLKEIEFGAAEETKKRKRKGPKGPNPLSCKKKKGSTGQTGKGGTDDKAGSDHGDKKRKRKKRIPNHIKRMFTKIETELYPSTSKD